ncbi:MAG: TRIC cation channel family protein [Epsilonproteobacteria bacterium]|nr:TRIC cation channel family protein [Campylobacterota bacterium]
MVDFFRLADLVGIIAFVISALSISTKERLDILGLFIIAFLTALGGGVIRDILVDRVPSSFANMENVIIVIGTIFVGLVLKLHQKNIDRNILFVVTDSIGLVSFAIAGALIGLKSDFTVFGIMLIALITAVGGGVMRDILLNQVPLLLKSDFYGSVALLVGLIIYLLDYFDALNSLTLSIVFIVGFAIRMLAFKLDWHLPKLKG